MSEENIVIKIQETAYKYRGQIINDLIHLERLIDEAISRHFCTESETKKELMELILCNDRLGFYNKIQIFEFIFKKHKTEFVSVNPNIFSDLKNLIAERNIVAHYLLDTSESGKIAFKEKGNIGFVKFKNSTETEWRTQEIYLKHHNLTSKYIESLSVYLTT